MSGFREPADQGDLALMAVSLMFVIGILMYGQMKRSDALSARIAAIENAGAKPDASDER